MIWAGVPVLVTGASGFTGSWLVRRLVAEGARVVVPLRPPDRLDSGADPAVERAAFDLTDGDSVLRVLNEYDVRVAFHLAARTIAGEAAADPHAAFEVNVRGTYALLEAVRRARLEGMDVRTVVASTYHVYGPQSDAVPFHEDLPLRPIGPYDTSKACADMLARSYAATYAMPVAVTRLANVYGGGDREESRLVAATARALVVGRRPVIRSDGAAERDFLYAEDAVDAYLAAAGSLDRPELWGRAWNAGVGKPVTVAHLVRRLAAAAGSDLEPEIRGDPARDGTRDRQFLDSSAIERELGWRPRWSLDDGLAETYRWYAAAA